MAKRFIILLISVLLPSMVPPASSQDPENGLSRAEESARKTSEQSREVRLERRRELERLAKDLRYISEELDREVLDYEVNRGLEAYSRGGLNRLQNLRERGSIDPQLSPALESLHALYRDLPKKEYAKEYSGSLARSITHELRWIAETAKTKDELLSTLREHLVLPEEMPEDAEGVSALAFFPVDLPLAKFKKLGPIRIFLMKHRIARPKAHAKTTWEDIKAGKHNVQIGVEIEGVVTRSYFVADLDTCFDIGDIHIEMTPEWRLRHRGIHIPKPGERIRVRGWSYYDVFHKFEPEYDPDDKAMGRRRKTVWEIHPVQDVELLP
ncbi:MAG: hypothetical protein AAB576_10635 [Elusimicrobiota bacterium]